MNNIKLESISVKEYELIEIAKWRNNCMESLRTPFKTSVDFESQKKWIAGLAETDKYFFIYDSITDKFLGYCGLNRICPINLYAEVSLLIGTPYQKKGYGKIAIESLLSFGFDILNLNCLYIEVYKTTNKFLGFWDKLGFRLEGVLRQRKFWDKKFHNSIIASILKDEYYMDRNKS